MTQEEVLVRAQRTPNPHAMKFIVNKPLKKVGKVTYRNGDDFQSIQLIEDIFNLENIVQVFLLENTLTVTHNGNWDNDELKSFVIPILKSRLLTHDPLFKTPEDLKSEQKKTDRKNMSPELKKIEEILDRTIRPGLQSDGGDLEVVSFEPPEELFIAFEGACGSCPSSSMGTLQAIQSILQNEYSPNLRVFID